MPLTHQQAIDHIVSKSWTVDKETGATNAILHDGDILTFEESNGVLDKLEIEHKPQNVLTSHGLPSTGSNEQFFHHGTTDVLEVDFNDGGKTIRFYFRFPSGNVDNLEFYFSESGTGSNALPSLQDPGTNIQSIIIMTDPPVGGPGPKTGT